MSGCWCVYGETTTERDNTACGTGNIQPGSPNLSGITGITNTGLSASFLLLLCRSGSLVRERMGHPVGFLSSPLPGHRICPGRSFVGAQKDVSPFQQIVQQNQVLSAPCWPQPHHDTCLIPDVLHNCVRFECLVFFFPKQSLSSCW